MLEVDEFRGFEVWGRGLVRVGGARNRDGYLHEMMWRMSSSGRCFMVGEQD